jgi:nitronate monooxygenase
MDWAQYDLATIFAEIHRYLQAEQLDIPLIPAGGIFTGSDAVSFLDQGAAAVQVATRFTVSRECGLPEDVKQRYFEASEDQIEVNQISPTGYPMRMLSNSPAIGDGIRPNCEAYGYLLDSSGNCSYISAYNREVRRIPASRGFRSGQDLSLHADAQLRLLDLWSLRVPPEGYVDPLAGRQLPLLSAEHIFHDYQFSTDGKVRVPE